MEQSMGSWAAAFLLFGSGIETAWIVNAITIWYEIKAEYDYITDGNILKTQGENLDKIVHTYNLHEK